MSDKVLLDAIDFAHSVIKSALPIQKQLRETAGKSKRPLIIKQADEELQSKVKEYVLEKIKKCVAIPGKQRRQDELDMLLEETLKAFDAGEKGTAKDISDIFYEIEKDLVRRMIIDKGIRADGRRPDEIRQITSKVGFLPRAHGSALFVRGETQALVVTTRDVGG